MMIKLNKNDIDLFKAISKSQLGKDLSDFFERLEDAICDSRTWGPNDTKESSQQAAKAIREVRAKITNPSKETGRVDRFD